MDLKTKTIKIKQFIKIMQLVKTAYIKEDKHKIQKVRIKNGYFNTFTCYFFYCGSSKKKDILFE